MLKLPQEWSTLLKLRKLKKAPEATHQDPFEDSIKDSEEDSEKKSR